MATTEFKESGTRPVSDKRLLELIEDELRGRR
jgi:hypothetical protein